MIKVKINNYLNIKIPEKLEKYLIGLGFLEVKNAEVIKLTFSNSHSGKVIPFIFEIDKLEKSLKDLTKKTKNRCSKLDAI